VRSPPKWCGSSGALGGPRDHRRHHRRLYPDPVERLIRRAVPWPGLAAKLAEIVRSFAHGLQVLHDPKRISCRPSAARPLGGHAWSFARFPALRPPRRPGGRGHRGNLSWSSGSPPLDPPGFAGVFAASIRLRRELLGVPAPGAGAAALTYHILTYIPITLLAPGRSETG